MDKPTHFPYNTALRPRRLDYLITNKIFLEEVRVGEARDVVGSDHEPVMATAPGRKTTIERQRCTWEPSNSKQTPHAVEKMNVLLEKQEDHHRVIAAAAEAITEKKKGEKFAESRALKDTRRMARQAPPGEVRRQLWKTICRQRRDEHKEWIREYLPVEPEDKTGVHTGHCGDLPSHPNGTITSKRRTPGRTTPGTISKKIFAKIDKTGEMAEWEGEIGKLRKQCKTTPWRPFTETELRITMQGWKWEGNGGGWSGARGPALPPRPPEGECQDP